MGQLHKLRAANKAITYCHQPTGDAVAVFERLHAESYFFHASIMMLFDRVIDPQLDPEYVLITPTSLYIVCYNTLITHILLTASGTP